MHIGPNIVTDVSLDIALDPSSQRSVKYNDSVNLLDYSTWIVGNTSATGFSRNGGSNENMIVTGTGPFGESATLWETRASGNSGGDGGWNSSYVSTDNRKTYRISVWVKRTSSTSSGTFYLGTNGGGACVLQSSNQASQCNPYFECYGTGGYAKDVWYLVVGHVLPYGTATNTRHPESGIYTIESGKVRQHHGCNVGPDMIHAAGTTSLRHRTYHYYCSDNTTRLQFAYPRLEEVTETTPTALEMLGAIGNVSHNLKKPEEKFYLANNLRSRSASTIGKNRVKKFAFDATNDYIKVDGGSHISLQRSIELVFRVNSTNGTYMPIAVYTRPSGGTESGKRIWLGVQSNRFRMHGWGTTDPESTTSVVDGSFYHAVFSYDQTSKRMQIWINGRLESNTVNTQAGMTGWSNSSDLNWWIGKDPQASNWTASATSYFNGDVGLFKTYNKILSEDEVVGNFKAYKNRFNI